MPILDNNGKIIGTVFEGTESELSNMGYVTHETFFRVHTHHLTKGECMPPSGADFMSAVTDSHNANRNLWQIVIAPDGYYIYRVCSFGEEKMDRDVLANANCVLCAAAALDDMTRPIHLYRPWRALS